MVDGSSAAERGDGVRGWPVFFTLATAGTVAIMLANPDPRWARTVAAVALVLAPQAVYLLLARPSLAGIRRNSGRGWVFAVVAVVTFGPAVALNPWSATSLFALTPEVFMLFTFGWAAGLTVALNAVSATADLIVGPHTGPDIIEQVGISLFIVTFSLFFGGRIVAIADRSAEQVRLIGQLREREAEVAALSAARGAEQERTRIARDMHDTLAQGFTSIVT
jgi:signal transduction histidine kinase